jgi:hypothetical protein
MIAVPETVLAKMDLLAIDVIKDTAHLAALSVVILTDHANASKYRVKIKERLTVTELALVPLLLMVLDVRLNCVLLVLLLKNVSVATAYVIRPRPIVILRLVALLAQMVEVVILQPELAIVHLALVEHPVSLLNAQNHALRILDMPTATLPLAGACVRTDTLKTEFVKQSYAQITAVDVDNVTLQVVLVLVILGMETTIVIQSCVAMNAEQVLDFLHALMVFAFVKRGTKEPIAMKFHVLKRV